MRIYEETYASAPAPDSDVSNRVFTAANIITFARLCLIPISLYLLFQGANVAAAAFFGITAGTDFLDGLVARKTNTVTRLGQLLDPLVDRVLIISAVVGLLVVGRLPFWAVALVVLRDLYLLVGGAVLLRRYSIRVPVSYVGKASMWFICIGCAGLILNMPQVPGLGICDCAFLPGLNSTASCAFIWLVYAGIILAILVAAIYTRQGYLSLRHLRSSLEAEGGNGD